MVFLVNNFLYSMFISTDIIFSINIIVFFSISTDSLRSSAVIWIPACQQYVTKINFSLSWIAETFIEIHERGDRIQWNWFLVKSKMIYIVCFVKLEEKVQFSFHSSLYWMSLTFFGIATCLFISESLRSVLEWLTH